jgi:predicted NodU family carbamoyl transferase
MGRSGSARCWRSPPPSPSKKGSIASSNDANLSTLCSGDIRGSGIVSLWACFDATHPFMTTVANVLPHGCALLEAVTHVDGTARLQTVTTQVPFGQLLEALSRQNGLPVVLNTSLNGKREPIVARAADAIAFFLSHAVDAMLLGDVLVSKERHA